MSFLMFLPGPFLPSSNRDPSQPVLKNRQLPHVDVNRWRLADRSARFVIHCWENNLADRRLRIKEKPANDEENNAAKSAILLSQVARSSDGYDGSGTTKSFVSRMKIHLHGEIRAKNSAQPLIAFLLEMRTIILRCSEGKLQRESLSRLTVTRIYLSFK